MKKYWLLLASISLTASILAACNTNNETNGDGGEPTPNVAETVKQDETTNEEKEVVQEDRGPEKLLSYTVNEEDKEEMATLTNSDEQNYSIYKLDGFELTGEEPNKDSLYLEENDAVFMRIETLSKDDASMEVIRKNMTETMAAVGIGKEPKVIEEEAKLPQGNGISEQYGMEVTSDLGTVSGIVFERGNLIVRLTIFDRNSENLTDAFLKMGETIATKQ